MKKTLVFFLLYLAIMPLYSKAPAQTNNNHGRFELFQNYPNPFEESTNIKFHLESDCFVKMFVKSGTSIQPLIEGDMAAGSHGIIYKNSRGRQPGTGKLVCVLEVYSENSGELIYSSEINMEQK